MKLDSRGKTVAAITAGLVVLWAVGTYQQGDPPARADEEVASPAEPGGDDRGEELAERDQLWTAIHACQELAERDLKAPSTAKWASVHESRAIRDDDTFRVATHVDAENTFGAMLRSQVACVIRDNGDGTWTSLSVEIG